MTLVIAHRGASVARPPGNTVEAFHAARDAGADWVELDVRPTADGVLAVHHDDRLPDGRLIAGLAGAELPTWVPTLTEALEACTPMGVNVEIKVDGSVAGSVAEPRLVADTVSVLAGLATPRRFLVSSFTWSVLDQVRQLAPELATALLGLDPSSGPDMITAATTGGHRAVSPWDPFVTPALVERAHGAGIEVHSWTVDDPFRMAELVDMEVDGIITNVPDLARSIVDESR